MSQQIINNNMIFQIDTDRYEILINEKVTKDQLDNLVTLLSEEFLEKAIIIFSDEIEGSPIIYEQPKEKPKVKMDLKSGIKVTDLTEKGRSTTLDNKKD